MRSAMLGFAAGVGVLQCQPALPAAWVAATLLAAAISGLWCSRRFKPGWQRACIGLVSGTACGFLWAALFAQAYLHKQLLPALEGKDLVVIGTIANLPGTSAQGTRFDFAIESAAAVDGSAPLLPSRVTLSWPAGFQGRAAQPVGDVQPGERWRFTVRLTRPHGNANPDGFDYEVWLLEQNLRATGSVRPDQNAAVKNQRLQPFVFSVNNLVERCRAILRARILSALPGKRFASVLVALVVGDQRGVAQADWTVFTRTGIGHLISISGLHITMIAGLFAWCGAALWRRSFYTQAALPLLLPVQKFAALVAVVTALLYVLLAGFGVPAQRTLYMIAVVATALWCGRLTSVSYILCTALFVVLVLDPWAVMSPGFWLSFGAVGTILYASVGHVRLVTAEGRWQRWRAKLAPEVHTQYVVTVGLIPLTMLLFGQVSLISPIANAIAIPLISFVVTPLALIGSVAPTPLAGWLLGAGHFCIETLALLLSWLSQFSLAVWSAPVPSALTFVAAAVGTLWFLTPPGWPLRWAGFVGWLPMLLNVPTHPLDGKFRVIAFDIGQGMALLVETSRHRLLYDTGPAFGPDSDGGSRVIVPYLKARGVGKLDAMVISHSDTDHSGGALSVLAALPVALVTTSLPLDHAIAQTAKLHRRCQAGQSWRWDGVQFDMLYPSPSVYDSNKWKPNAHSCTLKISQGGKSILLPGDIEAIQEIELVGSVPERLKSTVLLAPHHGSGTSSTLDFLRTVQPELALFQVGYRNRYHHPKPVVYARYAEQGIERIRTDDAGAITLDFGDLLTWHTYRKDHWRYWYGQ